VPDRRPRPWRWIPRWWRRRRHARRRLLRRFPLERRLQPGRILRRRLAQQRHERALLLERPVVLQRAVLLEGLLAQLGLLWPQRQHALERLLAVERAQQRPSQRLQPLFEERLELRPQRLHGGAIHLQSEPGAGTTFTVWLPAGTPPAAEPPPPAAPAHATLTGTLLFADDESIVRSVVSSILVREGWSVLQASDGEEALRLFEEHGDAIDVALLDVRMPGRSGVEVLGELRQRRPGLPVVLTTGYDGGHLEGVSGVPVLPKPFHSPALLQVLAQALENGSIPADAS